MITKISNGLVISDGKLYENKSIYINGDKIIAVTEEQMPYEKEIDAKGNYVSAGFIDIHVHGGGGHDFTDGGTQPILAAASFHAEHGTTTIVPTMPAASLQQIKIFLDDVRAAIEESSKNINIYGAHLEGPYLSSQQCGALNVNDMQPPNKTEYEKITEDYRDVLKRWTFAPELSGSAEFYHYLKSKDIIGSVGHSNAVFNDVERVYDDGCRLVTHLYSAMSTITRKNGFRRLGVVESALLLDDMMVELITDLRHLPAELIRLIYKIKGVDNICLITDAMRGAGMPDGPSVLGDSKSGIPCVIEDGVAKLTDRSAFAGSVATADRLSREGVKNVGLDVARTVKMMTINPARVMGMQNKGDIKEGMDADVVIFDDDIQIKKVLIMGK
mgnify:FL=1